MGLGLYGIISCFLVDIKQLKNFLTKGIDLKGLWEFKFLLGHHLGRIS